MAQPINNAELQAAVNNYLQQQLPQLVANQQQAPQGAYVSRHGTPMPPLATHKAFSNSEVALPDHPVNGFSKEPRFESLWSPERQDIMFVRTGLLELYRQRQSAAQKTDRMTFFVSCFKGSPPNVTARVSKWIQKNQLRISATLSAADEAQLLLEFIDFSIDIVCLVATPADALCQLKELQQEKSETVSDYLLRAQTLAGQAGRALCSPNRFEESLQAEVFETLTLILKGLLNSTLKDIVEYRLDEFVRAPHPTEDELQRIFSAAVRQQRAKVDVLTPSERTCNRVIGLQWTAADRDLMQDISDDVAVLNISEVSAMSSNPGTQLVYQPPTGILYACGRCKYDGHSAHLCIATKDAFGVPIRGTAAEWVQGYGQFLDGQDKARLAVGLPARQRKGQRKAGKQRDGDRKGVAKGQPGRDGAAPGRKGGAKGPSGRAGATQGRSGGRPGGETAAVCDEGTDSEVDDALA